MGQSGRGDRDPCETSGEGLAVRQDRAARASARAARAGEACDMASRGTASQNFDAAGVDQQSFAKDFSMSGCDMESRGLEHDL